MSAESIKQRWHDLTPEQQLDFAQAFSVKPALSSQDEDILDFLMDVATDQVCTHIALLLIRRKDRKGVLEFFLKRIFNLKSGRANYFQAIGLLGDPTAVPEVQRYFRQYHHELLNQPKQSAASDVAVYIDFISCCKALIALDPSEDVRLAREQLLNHDDEHVRFFAKSIFGSKH